MSGGKAGDSGTATIVRIPKSLPIVPIIQFNDSTSNDLDNLSTSPKRHPALNRKQFYRQYGDHHPKHSPIAPSPLSSSTDSGTPSPTKQNRRFIDHSQHLQKALNRTLKLPNSDFTPIAGVLGSVGDSSDSENEDSEVHVPARPAGGRHRIIHSHLHPCIDVGRSPQFRRHSWICFDVENGISPRSPMDSQVSPGVILASGAYPHNQRRESFLYRSDTEFDQASPKVVSRNSSIVSNEQNGTAVEELIVTPFAQVLASLRRVRNEFLLLTNLSSTNSRRSPVSSVRPPPSPTLSSPAGFVPGSDEFILKAQTTLEELDWCLEQLDAVQAHRSVSELASNKFKRMLNKELTQLSGMSKSGNQASEYISSTFLDNQNDVMSPNIDPCEYKDKRPASPNVGAMNKTVAKTRLNPSPRLMAVISGTKSSRNNETVTKWHKLPLYGVVVSHEVELAKELEGLDSWGGVDLFKVAELSNDRPLTCVMYTICKKRDMFNKFKIQPDKFLTYIMTLEDHYRKVAYHNSVHAADVAQSVHFLLSTNSLRDVFSDLEILSALIASAMHDVDHPGLNNQYHLNNASELALLYNDVSVLENHHLAVGFKLMQYENCDAFGHFTLKQYQSLRKMVIDMVLATDMSKHMELLASLKTTVEVRKIAQDGLVCLEQYSDRIEVLKNLVHCADLSNPMKPIKMYKEWISRIMQESWMQGDMERDLGVEISPMCDRHDVNVEKTQVMFIDYVVYPLIETWGDLVCNDGHVLLETLKSNREYYANLMPGSPSLATGRDSTELDVKCETGSSSDTTEGDFTETDTELNSTPVPAVRETANKSRFSMRLCETKNSPVNDDGATNAVNSTQESNKLYSNHERRNV